MQIDDLRQIVEQTWDNRDLLSSEKSVLAVREVVSLLDSGTLRVAEPKEDDWQVNEWVKKAVIMYFPIQQMETIEVGPFEFHDKIALKKGHKAAGVRVVPHAIVR